MNAQHISSPCPQQSPADRFIENSAPEGILRLAAALESLPAAPSFTVADLDALSKDDAAIERFDEATYLHGMLGRIGWWVYVAQGLTLGDSHEGEYNLDHLEDNRSLLLAELPGLFSGYTAALSKTVHYAAPGEIGVHVEFLKNYRWFTGFIGDWARRTWPHADLDWLHEQA